MTKKVYNQPQVQVTVINSMVVMQAASAPATGDNMGLFNTSTDTQW